MHQKDLKLRAKAEKMLDQKINGLDIPPNVKEIIHELQVHQIELEIQNEDLRSTQSKLQSLQNQYFELYNFSPTAYFTLDENELIKDVNVRAEDLLGLGRKKLIDKAFIRLVAPDSSHKFYKHLKLAISTKKHQKCDLTLLKDLKPVPVYMEISAHHDDTGILKSILITASDITELKNAENALKESEIKFKTVADFTFDWEYWIDPKGNLIYISPSCEPITGYSPDEFQKDPSLLERIVHQDDIKLVKKHFHIDLIGEEYSDVVNYRILTKQGEERWIGHGCKPVYDDEGTFLGRRVSNRDITEMKMIEEDLVLSNQWISFAQHAAKSGFWDWDMVTEKLTWSKELFQLFGIPTTKEASFDTWLDLIHPDDQKSAMDNINLAIEKHEFLENEYRIIRPNGKEVWIKALGSTSYDVDDMPIRMSGICLDITDQKNAAEDLLNAEKKYRYVLDNMLEGCQIIDAGWQYVYVNDTVARHGRTSKEKLLDHTMMEVYPGIEDTEMFAHMRRCMDERIPQNMVNKFIYPDGSFGWFELSMQPVPEGIFVLSIDITERKMTEEALKNSEKFLDTIIEHSAHSMWISDDKGNLIRQNQACRDLFQVSDQDVVGKYNLFKDNIVEEQGHMPLVRQVFEEAKTANFTLIYDTSKIKQLELSETTALILDVSIAPVLDENGMVKNAIIQHVDITERKKAEESLKETQREKSRILDILNQAQEIAKIGSWEWDLETDNVWWSKETYQIFGVGPDYIPSFEANKEFIHPDDLEKYQNEFEGSLKTGKPLDLDLRILTKNGAVKYCYAPGKVIYNQSGEPKKFIGNIMDITKRKKTEIDLENLLIDSERLKNELSTLIENIVDEVWFCDLKGNIMLVNAAARKFEQEAEFEASQSLNGLIKSVEVYDAEGNLRSREGSPLLRSLNGEILTDFEEIVVFPNSGRRQFRQVSSAPIKNENGEIFGAVAVVRDITHLKEAENELFKSEEFLKKIVENISDMIFVKNAPKLDFLMVNKAWEELLGHKNDELRGKTDYDFFTKKEAELFKSKDNEVLENKKLLDIPEETVQTKNLGQRILHTKKIPILNTKGEPQYLLGISEDITERRKAEIKIKENESFLRGIFDNMPSGMSVYQVKNDGSKGSDYIIKEFNQTSQQIEGMTREDVVGKSLHDIRPNIDEYGLIPIFKKVLDTGESIHYPAKIYIDEKFANWYENYVFKTSTGEIVSIYNDVTEQEMAKEKIKKSLQEKETLLKEIHHRVKNNMQIISSLLSLQSEYLDENVANILKGSQNRVRSMALVHEKLYHSPSLSRIDMGDYIQSLVSDLFYQHMAYNLPIKSVIEVDDINFNVETAIPCGLIITELVSNSLKYAFPKGIKGEICVSLKSKADVYELIIKDNGVGLPEDLDFEKLTSLGLQLVYNLSNQLDGDINLDKNRGTKFTITFSELDYEKRI